MPTPRVSTRSRCLDPGQRLLGMSLVLGFALACGRNDASSRSASSQPPSPGQAVVTTESAGSLAKAAADTLKDPSCERGPNGPNAAKAPVIKPGDNLAVNQSEYDGWKMFHVYCYRCHGVDALGGSIAPDLRRSVGPDGGVNHECFTKTVTNGRPAKGMPTWKALLSPDQIENIWNYLQARSAGRLAAGRPHTVTTGTN